MKDSHSFFVKLYTALPFDKLKTLETGNFIELGGEDLKIWIDIPGGKNLAIKPKTSISSSMCQFELQELMTISENEKTVELGFLAIDINDSLKLKRKRTITCDFPKGNITSMLISDREALSLKWNLEGVLSLSLQERILL